MSIEIQYLRHGTIMQRFVVPSVSGLPASQPIRAQMDSRLHKAIARATWVQDPLMSDVSRKDLSNVKGAPIGSLIAINRDRFTRLES